MAAYEHDVSYGDNEGWAYTEVIEDEALADLMRRGIPCRFRVIEDEWDLYASLRIIRKVEDLEIYSHGVSSSR